MAGESACCTVPCSLSDSLTAFVLTTGPCSVLGKNNWKTLLDKKLIRKIESRFKNEMSELGYL